LRAPLESRHYVALWNVIQQSTHPREVLGRYLFGTGSYPYVCRVRTPIGPIEFTIYSPDDMLTVNEIFFRGDYAAPRDIRMTVDLGSNIGVSALYFLTRNPEARCRLYEPDPRNVERLCRNLAGFESRFELREEAVADLHGVFSFGIESTGRYGGIGSPTGETIAVRARHINDILEEALSEVEQIDVLKVDIEGMEARVMKAIRPDLLGRIRRIYVESPEPLGDLYSEFFERSRRGLCEVFLLRSVLK
jgi:FkbM family methyltransferase